MTSSGNSACATTEKKKQLDEPKKEKKKWIQSDQNSKIWDGHYKKDWDFFLVKGFSQTKALNFVEVYVLWKIVSGIQINVFWK